MNIAIMGTGFIASVHAEILIGLGHTLSLIIGDNVKHAEEFASKWNAIDYSDTLKDIDNPRIEAVHICTPPALHYSAVKQCLNLGKHVVCEKPLCLNSDEALELINLSKNKNLAVCVDFNVRFHTLMSHIKETIASPEFGPVFLMHGNYLQEFHALPADYSWRYQEAVGGNMRAVTEIGSHVIDLMRYLTNLEIVEVAANFIHVQKERFLKDQTMFAENIADATPLSIQSEDAAMISLRFQNGAIANFTLSEVSHGRNNHINFEITGSAMSVWWNSETPFQYHTASKGNGTNTMCNAFGNGFTETIKDLIRSFYDSIGTHGQETDYPFPTLLDGYKNVVICNALYESSQNNGSWTQVTY